LLKRQKALRVPVHIEGSPDTRREFGKAAETGVDMSRSLCRAAVRILFALTGEGAAAIRNLLVDIFTKTAILFEQAVLEDKRTAGVEYFFIELALLFHARQGRLVIAGDSQVNDHDTQDQKE